MSLLKFYKNRDHNNGGKFDGNCAVDTMQGFGTNYHYGVRCRFRPEEFDSGVQAIWGVGEVGVSDEYSLKIFESSGSYYFRVTWLDVDYDYTDFPIVCGTFYEVKVKRILALTIVLSVKDQYANDIYYKTKTNTSDEVSFSLSVSDVYIGALNSASSISLPFIGIIYDWDYMDTSTFDFLRYVFYKNYHSVDDDEVADFLNVNTADIIGIMPDDFWPEKVDISRKVKTGSSAIIKFRQDKFRTQIGNSMALTLFNYTDIKVGDTIEIQIDDDVINDKASFLLNVTKIKDKSYAVINVQCEDIYMGLKSVTMDHLAQQARSLWVSEDNFWWSTYRNSSFDDYYWDTEVNRWISLKYIMNYIHCLLQYDNLISLDYATLLSSPSGYKFYDTGTTYTLNFSELVWHLGMLKFLGCGDYTEERVHKAYYFFRSILTALRIEYYFESGTIVYAELTYNNTPQIKYYFNEKEKITNVKFYQVKAEVIQTGTYVDAAAYFAAFSSGDVVTKIANNIDSNFLLSEDEIIIDYTLIKGFWIFRKHRYANTLRYIVNSDNFIDQFLTKLDNELRGLKEYETKEIPLTGQFSTNYYLKEDDLINRRSKIKQEVS